MCDVEISAVGGENCLMSLQSQDSRISETGDANLILASIEKTVLNHWSLLAVEWPVSQDAFLDAVQESLNLYHVFPNFVQLPYRERGKEREEKKIVIIFY